MSRPAAPSMPTERQIKDAHNTVAAIYPDARIARVGPEGVTFEYPEGRKQASEWASRPFSAASV